MKKLFLIYALVWSASAHAQTFQDYVTGLPRVNIPLKFKENYFVKWSQVNLPTNLFNGAGINLSKWKAVGTIDINENYYIILVKELYNNGNDFLIMGLGYSKTGIYRSKIMLSLSADGESMDFAILTDSQIQVLSYGANSGYLSTFKLEDGIFSQIGEKVYVDDVDAFKINN